MLIREKDFHNIQLLRIREDYELSSLVSLHDLIDKNIVESSVVNKEDNFLCFNNGFKKSKISIQNKVVEKVNFRIIEITLQDKNTITENFTLIASETTKFLCDITHYHSDFIFCKDLAIGSRIKNFLPFTKYIVTKNDHMDYTGDVVDINSINNYGLFININNNYFVVK